MLDDHGILRDTRRKGGGGEKILSRQTTFAENGKWDYSEAAIDIVAKSRRDMLRDAVYDFQKALSTLRTTARKIDSLAKSLLVIGFAQLLELEREERRNEEHGKAKDSQQTR